MINKMFCFQCEQTAGCTRCTGSSGVCGKAAPPQTIMPVRGYCFTVAA